MRLSAGRLIGSRSAYVALGFVLCLALVLAFVGFRAATDDEPATSEASSSSLAPSPVSAVDARKLAPQVDVNGDKLADAYVREPPYHASDVGANCDLFYSNGNYFGRLYIRPPYVWPLKQWGVQRVRWRARFYDKNTEQVIARGDWRYAVIRNLTQPTVFSGGPDVPQAATTSTQYWAAAQYYEHPHSDARPIRAFIDVGWQNPSNQKWIERSMKVIWMISTFNRSIGGDGQTGPATTPIWNWTC